jgi:hypothetical protein
MGAPRRHGVPVTSKDLDDEVLAERIRRGDRDAFAMLTTRYWTAVHRIARNMLHGQAEGIRQSTHRACLLLTGLLRRHFGASKRPLPSNTTPAASAAAPM